MANYFFTQKAVEDLSHIYEYTFLMWSEKQADKYYKELINMCEYIAKTPKSGKKYNEVAAELYGISYNRHIIFYRIINVNQVEIVRILGAEMDLKNRMKD